MITAEILGGMGLSSVSWGYHLNQVCNTEKESSIELEWADLEVW